MLDINNNNNSEEQETPHYDHPHLRQRNTKTRNHDHQTDEHHALSNQSITNHDLPSPPSEEQALSQEETSQDPTTIGASTSEPLDHQHKSESTQEEALRPPDEKASTSETAKESNEEEAQQADEEEPLCRICLSGRDDDDPSLGRFIQPCLCRGTMAFIHVGCLQRWRITSPSPKSFYRCDQCGYRYKLRRAKIAGLAENPAILGGCNIILSGFISSWLLESYSQITTLETHWDSGLGPFSYDSTGKIVGEVVGEAVRVLNSKLHVDDTRSRTRKAGTTPVRRSKLVTQSQRENEVSELKPIETGEKEEHTYRYVRAKAKKKGQEASSSEPIAIYSTRPTTTTTKRRRSSTGQLGRRQKKEDDDEEDEEEEEEEEPGNIIQSIVSKLLSKLEALIKHTIKGLAFIGVMSFFQLAMSVTLFSPWNFGIRNSVLRMMRSGSTTSRTSAGRAAAADPNGIGSLLILIFVLLGVLKAIQSVWKFVRKSSQWALRKIEDGVLDVRSN
ncbi:uncharacterized protein PGTG_05284 [Puccinia graminis f. sp. tritici CRL 75-36-700-3]|uniref:RING-CH-type domain-containing protein n=1 Tax=Puccinia graminis f. sp. tritici (strain CRL 75-36-700-3 / race SCCL) TaxID=418459 RepID=E3K6W0_PUCGT|nr:uncharacterized protein PGTG_05284 [Puccinia graminis f. sp. tritici CRL 75-36-700-3]EFP80059.1 hypothetical protein PGTG_05284 [Puccinia graminis f. sp. tritici CRL 75-36-700-3]